MSTEFKKDNTRLINLLQKYRNHMISNYDNKMKHVKLTTNIRMIDKSIDTIKFAMKMEA